MSEWSIAIAAASFAVVLVSAIIGAVWKLSAKIYQVEIWARDEFVRKDSFGTVVSRLERGMEQLGEKIEAAVDRMTIRIEKISRDRE